tara:strand:- start:1 stop:693 length:693 start_codon:yes stop_codon:yes gene_type:complete
MAKFKRKSNSELKASIHKLNLDRQPDLTELMLNDIDSNYWTVNDDESPNYKCTWRVTIAGTYLLNKSNETVQLSGAAKERLQKASGDAFSENDFRRCADFIRSQGKWLEGKTVFEIDSNAVNDMVRGSDKKRWPNLNSKKSKDEESRTKGRNKVTSLKFTVPDGNGKNTPTPEVKAETLDANGEVKTPAVFKAPSKAEKYYRGILEAIVRRVNAGGMQIEISLNNKSIEV